MGACYENPKTAADIRRLEANMEKHEANVLKELFEQDSKITELLCKFGGNFEAAFDSYLSGLEQEGKLKDIITASVLSLLNSVDKRTSGMINVKEFGAVGDGVWDDTAAIQTAIDHANKHGRKVYVPAGNYLISAPIMLNGCSLIGEHGNVFAPSGTVFECATEGFAAICQGSTDAADCMFTICDVAVKGAATGFEIVYAINSKFERLYAIECGTGFQIGDPSAVGCMFCEFSNLYTKDCAIAVVIDSAEYMNNNRFINGFWEADNEALNMRVTGGYGAIGNVFNNVEFRSRLGRGAVLTSCINTAFNSCYFECGANALRFENYCTAVVRDCTYGSFSKGNLYGDVNVIRAAGNGGALTVDGGIVYNTEENNVGAFFDATNAAVFQNVVVVRNVARNTSNGYELFPKATKYHEQNTLTGTVIVPAGDKAEVEYTFEKPFNSVPLILCATMRGESGTERGLSHCFSERTATGGKISITNDSTGDRAVSFSVYAKSMAE